MKVLVVAPANFSAVDAAEYIDDEFEFPSSLAIEITMTTPGVAYGIMVAVQPDFILHMATSIEEAALVLNIVNLDPRMESARYAMAVLGYGLPTWTEADRPYGIPDLPALRA